MFNFHQFAQLLTGQIHEFADWRDWKHCILGDGGSHDFGSLKSSIRLLIV